MFLCRSPLKKLRPAGPTTPPPRIRKDKGENPLYITDSDAAESVGDKDEESEPEIKFSTASKPSKGPRSKFAAYVFSLLHNFSCLMMLQPLRVPSLQCQGVGGKS